LFLVLIPKIAVSLFKEIVERFVNDTETFIVRGIDLIQYFVSIAEGKLGQEYYRYQWIYFIDN
jgi:hypothetical protein